MDNRRVSFGGKVKGFLGAPANAFNEVQAEALGSALKYFAILAAIYVVLNMTLFYTVGRGILVTLAGLFGSVAAAVSVYDFNPAALVLMTLLGAFAGLFISGSWAHLFVRTFGGRKGYGNTIKAFAYGETPLLLFGWIPLVGMLFWIWALVLDIIGIKQLHEISTGRAVGAVLLSVVSLVVIGAVIGVLVALLVVFLAVA